MDHDGYKKNSIFLRIFQKYKLALVTKCPLKKFFFLLHGKMTKIGASPAVSMTPLVRYDTAGAGDLEFERLWLPLKRISIKKIT
jgi:hypothetical protein